jgi:hypothetical protein
MSILIMSIVVADALLVERPTKSMGNAIAAAKINRRPSTSTIFTTGLEIDQVDVLLGNH